MRDAADAGAGAEQQRIDYYVQCYAGQRRGTRGRKGGRQSGSYRVVDRDRCQARRLFQNKNVGDCWWVPVLAGRVDSLEWIRGRWTPLPVVSGVTGAEPGLACLCDSGIWLPVSDNPHSRCHGAISTISEPLDALTRCKTIHCKTAVDCLGSNSVQQAEALAAQTFITHSRWHAALGQRDWRSLPM
jgi:hypothetical protein